MSALSAFAIGFDKRHAEHVLMQVYNLSVCSVPSVSGLRQRISMAFSQAFILSASGTSTPLATLFNTFMAYLHFWACSCSVMFCSFRSVAPIH